MRKATVTKAQIIFAIKKTARKLRRTPTRSEFERLTRIHHMKVQRVFGGYRVAVRAAGLEPDRLGVRIDTAAMLEDWGRVARRMKRHPTREEYEKHGRYAAASLETRFHRWSKVRERFLEFVEANGLERVWTDVVESLRSGPVPRRGGGRRWLKESRLPRINADERGSEKGNGRERAGAGERVGRSGQSGQGGQSGTHENPLPQMNADSRRSEEGNGTEMAGAGERAGRSGQSGQGGRSGNEEQFAAGNCLPRIDADEPGFEERPVNPEILPPPVRGKRCVTRSMLWILFAGATPLKHTNPTPLKHGGTEERGGQSGQSGTNGKLLPQMNADERGSEEGNGAAGDWGIGRSENRVIGPSGDRIIGPSGYRFAFGVNATEVKLYFPKRVLPGRPLMGRPMHFMAMGHEPVNEMGVVFLFAMIAHQLGFVVDALQMGYPDCLAKLEVEPGRWQDVRIEFEWESRKFREHGHDPAQCDIIVCWRHNWKGCPERIQVIELRKILRLPELP